MLVVATRVAVGNEGMQLFILWFNYTHLMDPQFPHSFGRTHMLQREKIETKS